MTLDASLLAAGFVAGALVKYFFHAGIHRGVLRPVPRRPPSRAVGRVLPPAVRVLPARVTANTRLGGRPARYIATMPSKSWSCGEASFRESCSPGSTDGWPADPGARDRASNRGGGFGPTPGRPAGRGSSRRKRPARSTRATGAAARPPARPSGSAGAAPRGSPPVGRGPRGIRTR